jgi:Fur family ferric uptake transcriptional regulator
MQEHENQFRDFLKQKGLKLTKSRNLVLEAAFKLHEHFDAETLYSHIRAANVSLATVYRTLPLLVEAGLIQLAVRSEGRDRFEHILGHPKHVHWICERCKQVAETDLSSLQEALDAEAKSIKFQIGQITINITGLCRNCSIDEYEQD